MKDRPILSAAEWAESTAGPGCNFLPALPLLLGGTGWVSSRGQMGLVLCSVEADRGSSVEVTLCESLVNGA